MPSTNSILLSDTALLRQAMLFFQLEQRHLLAAQGSHTHGRMLIVLRRKGPLAQSDLARMLSLEKSWVSRALDRLVEAGWVSREADVADRRRLLLSLTSAGLAQAQALETVLDQHAAAVLARVPAAEREAVVQAMRALHAALDPAARAPHEEGRT